jgi:hypothetical protein
MLYITLPKSKITKANQWVVANVDKYGENTFIINKEDDDGNEFAVISFPDDGSDYAMKMLAQFGENADTTRLEDNYNEAPVSDQADVRLELSDISS